MDRITSALLIIVTATSTGFACSCAEEKSIYQEFKDADAVFVGTVCNIVPFDTISTTKIDNQTSITFFTVKVEIEVEKNWKGTSGKQVFILTAATTASCGFEFQAGQKYLVYAYAGKSDELWTSVCARTKKFALGENETKYFR